MKVRYILCEKCGKKEIVKTPVSDNEEVSRIMLSKCYCYECAFWEAVKSEKFGEYVTINGVCYNPLPPVYDEYAAIGILGQNGKKMWMMKRNGELVYSNDCWVIGVVPQRLLTEFPDTAFTISKRAYNIIRRRGNKCNKKGCMDRYHCFLYDLDCESEGRFNKIPNDYKVGEEKCTRFINLNKDIERYDITLDLKTDSTHIPSKK